MSDVNDNDEFDLAGFEDETEPGDQDSDAAGDTGADERDDDAAADDGDEIEVLQIGDDEVGGQADDNLVRRLRRELAQRNKRIAEMERSAPRTEEPVGERPVLADFDYDEDRHNAALDAWYDRKRQADARNSERDQAAERERRERDERTRAYAQAKAALQFDDVQDAEDAVATEMSDMQQAVILGSAKNPALVVYALGRSAARRAEFAKIEDPLKLAAAIGSLEKDIKMTKKRKAPAPDAPVPGRGAPAQRKDAQLERLEKQAERTGDRTDLINYKRRMKAA